MKKGIKGRDCTLLTIVRPEVVTISKVTAVQKYFLILTGLNLIKFSKINYNCDNCSVSFAKTSRRRVVWKLPRSREIVRNKKYFIPRHWTWSCQLVWTVWAWARKSPGLWIAAIWRPIFSFLTCQWEKHGRMRRYYCTICRVSPRGMARDGKPIVQSQPGIWGRQRPKGKRRKGTLCIPFYVRTLLCARPSSPKPPGTGSYHV